MEEEEAEELNQEGLKRVQVAFEGEREQLVTAGQAVLSRNRNTNIAFRCLQDKMGEMNIEKESLEYDYRKLTREREALELKQQQLEDSLKGNIQHYHRLMKSSRELEEALAKERRRTCKVQHDLQELTTEVEQLEQK
jgi:RNase H-fold protein (predicted Holliday junction resolvase)